MTEEVEGPGGVGEGDCWGGGGERGENPISNRKHGRRKKD